MDKRMDKIREEITSIKSKCICFQAKSLKTELHTSRKTGKNSTEPYYLTPY